MAPGTGEPDLEFTEALMAQAAPVAPATAPRPGWLQRIASFELTSKKVSRRELMHFSRQMAVFVRAGVPMLDALDAITEEMDDKTFREALLDIRERLRAGETFADAATAHPEVFPHVYSSIITTAEWTGHLDEALDRIAVYIERDMEARRKVKEALMYPGIVFCLSIAVVIVLTVWVIPKFETFFKSFDAKLPLTTRILLDVAQFISNWWYLLVVGLVALAGGMWTLVKSERGRQWLDSLVLRVPVIGDLVKHAVLERFCRILSTMVMSGVPLPEAMVVTTNATNNSVFRSGLMRAREGMLRGEGLSGPMARSNLFPASARQMFKVGESTGTLDAQLEVAATYFDRELDYKLKRFTSLFEPAVILFAGLFVGFVAIALVSAMYGIYRQVHLS
ncbi:MAG TPA: type II secretion system F family protein [Mycobacteriales bacterium]|nr:type II secretion system F family protein [Mycobacteriales bacterium]